jgi:hypothetical protein
MRECGSVSFYPETVTGFRNSASHPTPPLGGGAACSAPNFFDSIF